MRIGGVLLVLFIGCSNDPAPPPQTYPCPVSFQPGSAQEVNGIDFKIELRAEMDSLPQHATIDVTVSSATASGAYVEGVEYIETSGSGSDALHEYGPIGTFNVPPETAASPQWAVFTISIDQLQELTGLTCSGVAEFQKHLPSSASSPQVGS